VLIPPLSAIQHAVSLGNRVEHINRLRTDHFDLVVIGGGITGAGIALDAASRGLAVALIEKSDFASGTSSRSTKLIHGGLRYLAQFRFRLTREALAERSLLQQLAPHLVEPIPFLFPIYQKRLEVWRVNTGLWLYDLLAGLRKTKVHRRLNRAQTLQRVPSLRSDNLRASFVYYDARTDDSRLVVEVLKAAVDHGAVVANYISGVRIDSDSGQAQGVRALDQLSGQTIDVRARKVVVATGVWLDQILNVDLPDGPRRIRPAKGVHIIVAKGRFGFETAVAFPTRDGRLMFVIPWIGATLIGTTDTDYDGPLDDPRADRADLDYLLREINYAFPGVNLTDGDVISIQAGLRPLIADSKTTTASVSREDRVFECPDGTIAIAGGKLTTYRRMGRKVVDLVVKRLGQEGVLPKKIKSRTSRVLIGGFPEKSGRRFGRLRRLGRLIRRRRGRGTPTAIAPTIAPDAGRRLWRSYGANWQAVVDLAAGDSKLAEPLVDGLDFLKAEIVFAVRNEMALTLMDVLTRRTHVAALLPDQARGVAPVVAALLARELGWNAAETDQQIADYLRLVDQFSVEPLRR
jgi:glycerol-3-phosphate dehydrogenase